MFVGPWLPRPVHGATKSAEAAIKKQVVGYWEDIKARRYEKAYARLATFLTQSMSVKEYRRTLEAFDAAYTIESITAKEVQRKGSHAVVTSVVTGHFLHPVLPAPVEMRITGQTILVWEKKQWRFATGDEDSRRRYVRAHPELLRQFKFKQDDMRLKVGGEWKTIGEVVGSAVFPSGAGKPAGTPSPSPSQ